MTKMIKINDDVYFDIGTKYLAFGYKLAYT